jgi:acetolactate synthase-1/2/3 large subunit
VNGAEALLRTLAASGVELCFANPGTTEVHVVDALDRVPEVRPVLALFEGVATGAADGYARMAGRPAAALLHLGSGLGNGLANLHNARRAGSPVVTVVGDHATHHQVLDTPLQSDISTVARNVSSWIASPSTAAEVGDATAAAVAAAWGPPGGVATLIVPADASWADGAAPAPPAARPPCDLPDPEVVERAAAALRGGSAALLLGGRSLHGRALEHAGRVAAATGARLLSETFPARMERGAGRPAVERLAYLGELAEAQMTGLQHLVLVDADAPATFFAHQDRPSGLVPAGCELHVLAGPTGDPADALAQLADAVDAASTPAPGVAPDRPAAPDHGDLDLAIVAQAIGALLPEGAIVSDEGNTSGVFVPGPTAGAAPHDWLTLTGGAIGQGLPVAVGAALACPDRPVVALQADGASLYTHQALWTMAREGLDITVVLFDNRRYSILDLELDRVSGGAAAPVGRSLFDLTRPAIDHVLLAAGFGVPASRAETAEQLVDQLGRALASPGPYLVDVVVAPLR